MFKVLFAYTQYITPQRLFSKIMGYFADSKIIKLKNWMIKRFIKTYRIDLSEALIKNPTDYSTFNEFFIRRLEADKRPIAEDQNIIVSPVDGTILQMGAISDYRLLQIKNSYFDLPSLCADNDIATLFKNGQFATLYLAPYNYHRVHMPLTGELIKTLFIPGKLFSVNQITTQYIPALYSKNERLLALFKTEAGMMAVIMVGAMIVGSIKAAWENKPYFSRSLETKTPQFHLKKGEELGYFKLGSTVIVLFQENRMKWQHFSLNSALKMGTTLGQLSK